MPQFRMTQPEARALAKLIQLLRNRTAGPPWDLPGIEIELGRAVDMADAPDLAVAAIRAAVEPINRTPAVIGMGGPHWRQAAGPVRLPPEPAALLCTHCGKTQHDCQAAYRPEMPDAHRYVAVKDQPIATGRTTLEDLRAAWKEGRAKLCPVHGAASCDTCEGFRPADRRARTSP